MTTIVVHLLTIGITFSTRWDVFCLFKFSGWLTFLTVLSGLILLNFELTHHGPVPHICVAIFSAYFTSAPDMWRWFQCSFPQCPMYGASQTARSSPVPQIVVARLHLLSHQRPIYVARHGPLSLHVLYGKYQMLSPKYWMFFPITVFHKL